MEAVLLPSLIGSGEKIAVYLEPVPLNSESEPPLTLISARVKSEEDSESSNSISPTISVDIAAEWCPVEQWRRRENYCCHCHLC